MADLVQWLREQIEAERQRGLTIEHSPTAQRFNPEVVPMAAREIYARCEAYTAILDDCVDYLDNAAVTDGLAMRALDYVALAYQHRPGYAEAVADDPESSTEGTPR